jgi:CRP/FNR family transcriptional regulator, cyclic AMP receptor protein
MSQHELLSALKEIAITDHLSESELQAILQDGRYSEYDKGHYVFREGEATDTIFLLISGVVKLTKEASQGREVLKSVVHPKAILGELSVLFDATRKSNAVVMSPIVGVYEVSAQLILKLIKNNNELALSFVKYMSNRMSIAEERLESFVLNDARERIVEFLKINAESFGQAIGYEMLLKHNFTQQDIANYTGTSRQTVTMVLNDLKKTNKILFKRQSILIRDIKALN